MASDTARREFPEAWFAEEKLQIVEGQYEAEQRYGREVLRGAKAKDAFPDLSVRAQQHRLHVRVAQSILPVHLPDEVATGVEQEQPTAHGGEREASAGLVATAGSALVELKCETDFVAKSDDFQALADKIANALGRKVVQRMLAPGMIDRFGQRAVRIDESSVEVEQHHAVHAGFDDAPVDRFAFAQRVRRSTAGGSAWFGRCRCSGLACGTWSDTSRPELTPR